MTRWMWLGWAIVACIFVAAILCANVWIDRFPQRVPIHWGIKGEPDGYANRDQTFIVFYLMPTIVAGVLLLGTVLPWLSPQQFKIDSFRRTYDYVFFLITAMFGVLNAVILRSYATAQLDVKWFVASFFLFFIFLGNVLGKVRKNFWMGVRTPWTLASDVVWEKTHRLAAWLFVIAGVVGFVASLLGVPPQWCFFGVIAAALFPVFYSLVIYKRLERSGQL